MSGYFDSRQRVWEEPIYRNVWNLLREFGDAELASLISPRALVVEHSVVAEDRRSPAGCRPRRRGPGQALDAGASSRSAASWLAPRPWTRPAWARGA